jgi:hypothetical protein
MSSITRVIDVNMAEDDVGYLADLARSGKDLIALAWKARVDQNQTIPCAKEKDINAARKGPKILAYWRELHENAPLYQKLCLITVICHPMDQSGQPELAMAVCVGKKCPIARLAYSGQSRVASLGKGMSLIMTQNIFYTLPDTNILLLGPVEDLQFFDTQSVPLAAPMTPLQAWGVVMARPMPFVSLAFKIRDAISSLFGVQKIGGFSGATRSSVEVGEKLDFFLVEHVSDDVMVLTARDRHLDVATCVSVLEGVLSITSSVQTHNLFGRAYMIPVAPAHRWIVRGNLRQIKQASDSGDY